MQSLFGRLQGAYLAWKLDKAARKDFKTLIVNKGQASKYCSPMAKLLYTFLQKFTESEETELTFKFVNHHITTSSIFPEEMPREVAMSLNAIAKDTFEFVSKDGILVTRNCIINNTAVYMQSNEIKPEEIRDFDPEYFLESPLMVFKKENNS
ncbi:MAG: hypothetical protein ACYTFY_12435 [Planctomycetota bacterium]|jgi:hypothetical protein